MIKIFSDKSLADIDDTRLLALKKKTMSFTFTIHHIDGKKNLADTFSRYPVSPPDEEDMALADSIELASIDFVSNINAVLTVTETVLRDAIDQDEQYLKVIQKVRNSSFARIRSVQ